MLPIFWWCLGPRHGKIYHFVKCKDFVSLIRESTLGNGDLIFHANQRFFSLRGKVMILPNANTLLLRTIAEFVIKWWYFGSRENHSSQGKTAVPWEKLQFPGKNLSEQKREPTNQPTYGVKSGIVPRSHCWNTSSLTSHHCFAGMWTKLSTVTYAKRAFNSVRGGNILRQSVKNNIPSSTATGVVSSVLSVSSSAFEIHTRDNNFY